MLFKILKETINMSNLPRDKYTTFIKTNFENKSEGRTTYGIKITENYSDLKTRVHKSITFIHLKNKEEMIERCIVIDDIYMAPNIILDTNDVSHTSFVEELYEKLPTIINQLADRVDEVVEKRTEHVKKYCSRIYKI